MKSKKRLAGIGVLAGGILLILAFFPRGRISHILLFAFSSLWLLVAWFSRLWRFLRSAMKRKPKRIKRTIRKIKKAAPKDPDPVELLMAHVNARITEQLHSVYPNAHWKYGDESPATAVVTGGTIRIFLNDAGEFRQGTVSFEDPQNLDIQLIRTEALLKPGVPPKASESFETEIPEIVFEEEAEPTAQSPSIPKKDPPPDVSVWYSLIGRDALTNLITDLNVRGCSSLEITEDGEVLITAEGTEMKESTLDRMPKADFWPELIKLMEDQGLTVKTNNKRLAIAW